MTLLGGKRPAAVVVVVSLVVKVGKRLQVVEVVVVSKKRLSVIVRVKKSGKKKLSKI